MSWFSAYKEWVRRNSSLLSVWETGLSSLTWILPDRFSESELTLEAIHTAINLVSTFHDSIINESTSPASENGGTELLFLLGALQQVQVLVELGAGVLERQGRGSRYDALSLMEALKALLRMLVLYRSNTRMLTNGGLTNFEQWAARYGGRGATAEARAQQVVDAFAQFRSRHCSLNGLARGQQQLRQDERGLAGGKEGGGSTQCNGSTGSMNGASAEEGQLWWQGGTGGSEPSKVHLPGESSHPSIHGGEDGAGAASEGKAVQRWAASRHALAMRLIIGGELLHILRPLVYTMSLRRWGRNSWRPWLSSLAVDLLSWQLTSTGSTLSQGTAQRAASNPALKGSSAVLLLSLQAIRWSSEERDELTRRKVLLVYYLLRDPLFARYTGPAVQRWQGLMGRIPLVGRLSDKVVDILLGMQQYYTYTAAS